MNERIRERQKERIRQIIEQSQNSLQLEQRTKDGGYPLPAEAVNQSSRLQTPQQLQPTSTVQVPPIVPREEAGSLPPVEMLEKQPPILVKRGEYPVAGPVQYVEHDPEKLWKSSSAPWLGLNRSSRGVTYGDLVTEYPPIDPSNGGGSRFLRQFRLQIIASAVLFGAIWGLFQLNGGMAEQGQTIVTAALTDEFDFQTVEAWYDRTFAGSPAFIPLFGEDKEAVTAVEGTPHSTLPIVSPLPRSTLIKSFAESLGGIELAGEPGGAVEAAETGQVILVTPDSGKGQTVVIQHAGGRQTQYGQLASSSVSKDDWVEAGDVIGKLQDGSSDESGILYFAVKEDGRFIDPTDVIPLD
ncbi:stage IV sporulation protein FA [Paenibacillus cellulosilyticus]|uniref:Stage IV sporulation protein FA n=1 Tax=Paenibacillus cellulosilyticus TaxID=375489 RepID=A0A2V2YGF7_9BACL|nr:M23 family metallopeptidase [Paenibacillus cellulosilyticus]PWV91963.1 stage IV sporulation protein FA [Paenibacillus cellulosilyticus]QKS46678.1 M23 family metallopeptidase [Paenibacillus cellulosilyticus]